ncbi:hypothetical protein [Aeromicrobium duanguangcaii]|uniref:Uncharacterized protein n=1 Tax=Aeromicrobium duanguangcaii TaxID=2968086 RepID=A0ABY5KGU1_9ACTN|nr:hypothetical protein [Aeromicrobium duanguangcaii]MCD9155085.1 hypothetical protein [Aeromicrobium duanguangcaii]UUI68260.1 hypothetical protein NP095_13765 [Aeromicrobium duanguangcaii]
MLSRSRHLIAVISGLAVFFAATLVALSATAARADDDCDPPAVLDMQPDGTFSCTIPGGTGNPGSETPGGEGPGAPQPSCDLAAAPAPTGQVAESIIDGPYCVGERFCVTTSVFVPMANPPGEPPNEDSEGRLRFCSSGLEYQWESAWWTGEEEPPTLLERARTAIGQIDLATPTLRTSPSGRTLVRVDTWFWATGASTSESGSAFDLVATATFASMSVDPGDGSGAFSCPLTTTSDAAASDCLHRYRRASLGGGATVDGRPAYRASVRLVYDLSFTVGGTPVVVPGAPTTLEAPVATAAIRVDEVQSIVTGVS